MHRFHRGPAMHGLLLIAGLMVPLGGCFLRRESNTDKYQFKPCERQRYIQVINSTGGTYDVYLASSLRTRLYMGTVSPNSRIDLPIDASISSGLPEVIPVGQTRGGPGGMLGKQYATIVCR